MEADILKSKKDLYLVPEVWRPIFCKSKKELYLVQKYGGRYFAKVLFINLFYFVVSISIATCSIVMDVSFVIEAAERHLIYFVATELMSLASHCFHFVVHLFFI